MQPPGPLIPLADRRRRNPLLTPAGYRLFDRIRQHPHAPRWTYEVGDRVIQEDLPEVDFFREAVFMRRRFDSGEPPPDMLAWLGSMRPRVPIFREHLPEGFNLLRDWVHIETMSREDLALRLDEVVPEDADLTRLIVYDTSGTTGHALAAPHHPLAMAKYLPLIEFVLARHGLKPEFGPDMVACFNVTARAMTVTFPNVFSVWQQAGFAKVNLNPRDWRSVSQARSFFKDLAPYFLTGDPVGFAELLSWGIEVRPAALISTAVTMEQGLKTRLKKHFGSPVIDWYSSTETGPIAYECPAGRFHLLPPDLYLEILDQEGYPARPGEPGEITVTGGRNPYLPLLRYRTGDFARLDQTPCGCGDPSPVLLDFQGRGLVFFRAVDGSVVNPVDVGLVMREFVFIQHEFIQRADGSCRVNVRPAPGVPLEPTVMADRLRRLFGREARIQVRLEEGMKDRKVQPYYSEMKLD